MMGYSSAISVVLFTVIALISILLIAKALGRPQRTFADQMKRYRTELRKIRGY